MLLINRTPTEANELYPISDQHSKKKRTLSGIERHCKSLKRATQSPVIMPDDTTVDVCQQDESSSSKKIKDCGSEERTCLDVSHDGSAMDLEGKSYVDYTLFDYSDIVFPEEGGMKPKTNEVKLPDNYPQDQANLTQNPNRTKYFKYFSMMDYRDTKPVSKAKTWAEFKKDHKKRLLAITPEDHDHAPLVSVATATGDLSEVLGQLTLSKTMTLNSLANNRK